MRRLTEADFSTVGCSEVRPGSTGRGCFFRNRFYAAANPSARDRAGVVRSGGGILNNQPLFPAISGATFGAGSQPKGAPPPTSLFFACRAVPASRDKAATKKCLHFTFPAMYAPIFGRPESLQAYPVARFIFRVSGHHRQIMPPAAAGSRARRLFGPPRYEIRQDATKPARGPEIGLSGDARFSGHRKSCG